MNDTPPTPPDHMITDQSQHDSNAQQHSHAQHDETIPKDLPKVGTGKVILATAIFVALLIAMFLIGYIPSRRAEAKLNEEARAAVDSKPIVNVVRPKKQDAGSTLVLPGDVQAMQSTSIFPRANGYLKTLSADIGDSVKEGQTLAEIATPEVDAQLLQSRAAVQQQQANIGKAQNDFDLAKTTLERYQNFAKSGGVTQQQIDEKESNYTEAKSNLEGAKASLASATANVTQLEATQSFQKVVAPFAGKITARNFDVGALLSSNGNKEMFHIAQTDTLRVFVNVPQTYATLVKIGQEASLLVSNYPGKPFVGHVTRSSAALDPVTRTIKFQVDFPNEDGRLYAGMYAQIKFELRPPNPPVTVPTSALVYNAKGLRLALISDGKVHYQTIEVGRDFGTEVEVSKGLDGDELIVTNPGERLIEGVAVRFSDASKPALAEHPTTKPAVVEATR